MNLLLTLLMLAAPPGTAAGPTPEAWATGAALTRELGQAIGISWSGTPLRQTVYDLCHARHVSALVDCRVDPDQRIEVSFKDTPLEKVLREICERQGIGMTVLGPVVYLGPVSHTAQLRTLAELRREEARNLPAGPREKLLRAKALQWPDCDTPREILGRLAAEAGSALAGLEQVPHDLWAAADLAPLPLVDRLTLVAGQFHLTFSIAANGRSMSLVPIPAGVAIVRSYAVGAQSARLAEKWAAAAPAARIKAVGKNIYVRGLLEDHERLTGAARPPAGTAAKASPQAPGDKHAGRAQEETRFTLKQARGQLDQLLTQLAARTGVEVRVDQEALERAGISLRQQVTFSVTDATLEDLFKELLKPAGCTCRRTGNVIEVRPAK